MLIALSQLVGVSNVPPRRNQIPTFATYTLQPLQSFTLYNKANNLDLYQSLPKNLRKVTLFLLSIPPPPQMASLSISVKLALPNSLLYSQTPKTLLCHNLSIVSRSNFYGLKLLHSPSLTTPSSTKSSIFAKVHTLLSHFTAFSFF